MRIHIKQLPCDQATFLAKFDSYKKDMVEHRLTVGVPAPFPEFEAFRTAWEKNESFEIYDDPPAAAAPIPSAADLAAAALAAKRAAALAALDDARLAAAAFDPAAPQAVKDYAAEVSVAP